MADGTDGAGAAYGFGSNVFFGNVGMGVNRFDGVTGKQLAASSLFGTQLRLPDHLPIAVCPVGQFEVGFGPNLDPVSYRTHTFSGGGRIGLMTGDPENFNVVPTAGFSIVRSGLYRLVLAAGFRRDGVGQLQALSRGRRAALQSQSHGGHSGSFIPDGTGRSRPYVQRDVQLELLAILSPGTWPCARFRVQFLDQGRPPRRGSQ